MRLPSACLLACALAAGSMAQSVNDVGLTMDGGVLTVLYGQACGPTGCAPFFGASVAFGETRTLMHYAAVNTPFILAMGLPAQCWQVPGIANDLLLAPAPIATLAVGVASQPLLTSNCPQARARHALTLPPAGPAGIVFRLQSLGIANSGVPAFGPAIEVTTR